MKTQVIHLESYDDRHSILDRLNWGQADRIIMIWPLRGEPLDHKLDLKLIHRRCQTTNIKLALVCKQPEVVDEARSLGIPVFRSLRQAQRIAWEYTLKPYEPPEKPQRKYTRQELAEMRSQAEPPAWVNSRDTRIAAFSISILAVLIMALFLIPGATITYQPSSQNQELDLTLTADPAVRTFNLSGTVPAKTLSISVEGRDEVKPSGETSIPDQAATGIITFTNLTDQEITIPAGTIIRTADPNTSIRFATSTETSIAGTSGATTLVPIEAINPGPNSNLPANTLVIIEGDLSRLLTAANQDPTSGGTERRSPSPSVEDYETLREALLASLWQTALEEAAQLLDPKDMIIDDEPLQVFIQEETFTPAQPEPSASLSLILQVEYEIHYISWEDLYNMGNTTLDAVLPAGYQAQPATLEIDSAVQPALVEDGVAIWPVTYTRQIFESDQIQTTIEHILGKTPSKAAQMLQSELDLPKKPEIEMWPEWWPLIPLMEIRISAYDLPEGS